MDLKKNQFSIGIDSFGFIADNWPGETMQDDIESVPVFLLLKKIFKENLTGKLLVKYDKNIKTLFLKKG